MIITAICPICGKEYKFREEYYMKNKTCPTRECKNKYQEENVKKRLDLVGRIFGRLEVIDFWGWDEHNHPVWVCACDCGNEVRTVKGYRLLDGSVKSCGCSEEKQNGIIPAKMVCPLRSCPHHMLQKIFKVKAEPVITNYVIEAGGCMCEITPEEEQDGLCGMRRSATQEEIAEIYQVWLNAVQTVENKAIKTLQKRIGIDL